MSRDCDRTIGPKTATKRYGGASARCSALSQPDRPSDSLAFTLPPTTISTFNAIWSLDRPFGSSGQKQPRNEAVQPQRHDPRHAQITITTDAAQLDKASPAQDHPHIYIDMGAADTILCPYCGTRFRFDPRLTSFDADPPGSFFADQSAA